MVGLHMGALCKPIEEQLKEQGIFISVDNAMRFQKIADAIITLHLHRIIADGAAQKAREKLMMQISRCIHGMEK